MSNLGAENPNDVVFDVPGDTIEKPWSEVTFNGDTFIKFNKMYRKILTVTDNQITSFSISNKKLDDNYELYPCFIDESGNELDYILVGKYMSKSSDTCNSVATGEPISQTISNGREKARARGTGYQLMDWRIHRLWQDLIICLYKTVNINGGILAITTDRIGLVWSVSGELQGEARILIDGFCHIDSSWVCSNLPSKYIDSPTATSEGYTLVSGYTAPTTGNEIKKLGYDSAQPFFNYPSEVVTKSNSNYDTYYCDGYWYAKGNKGLTGIVTAQSYPESNDYAGAFACSGTLDWSHIDRVRLCYRPAATSGGETETDSSMPKLAVTGITEVKSPLPLLNIPEHTFEFGDQNKIGTVVAIEDAALRGNDSTKISGAVTVADTVEKIGRDAFLDCTGITSVSIGSNITSIGLAAFACCPRLTDVFWYATNCIETGSGTYPIFGSYPDIGTTGLQDTAIKNVVIGDRVTELPAYVFSGCSSLVDIYINSKVKSIGLNAFSGSYTNAKDVAIDGLYDFCQINFANQYANPLNLAGETRLYKTLNGVRTEITSIDTNDLYSSNKETTLPALFQRCCNINKIEINSGLNTVVKVVYTNGSTDSTRWNIPTLDIYSCAVGSYFDEAVFLDSFETVRIYFASTWAAYDGDTLVDTISPTGPTGANWNAFFNNNATYKIMRTQ